MRAFASRINGFLPRGVLDACWQFALFFLAYNGYQVVRGITDGGRDVAFANADRLIDVERSLGTYFEAGFQQTLLDHASWLVDFANFMYLNSHFVITTGFLAWLYLFRNDHFYFVRNMFMVAMALALACYALYPTAPPRLMPGEGFTDTIATFTGVAQDDKTTSLLVNQYAAVPSMHIAFSLMIAVPAATLSRHVAHAVAVVGVPAPRLLRDRGHGQPLLARRSRRRRGRLRRRADRPRPRSPAPGRLVVARGHARGDDLSRGDPPRLRLRARRPAR